MRNRILPKEYYLKDTLFLARDLIGKYLVNTVDGEEIALRILETEAYIGSIDKACHAYGGRRTQRTEVLYAEGGTAYIYLIYGMYYCMNIVTEEKDTACAVLIRGGEIVKGKENASLLRYGKSLDALSKYQLKNFSNGPGKVCKAMAIDKSLNYKKLYSDNLYVADKKEEDPISDIKISKRINIDYAEEAKDFLWRFYV
ncbi:DNA-3-methyladenine glycosylase [Anaeropeptidivorans aminofermentans]|uniref:DNA-3-methyladenine glycosylase n=1 Tax=Anaeropeptidivorans aminofermentans TaxID=2934315 RepID=UPI0020258066|nr:DNA-3-methyladenine glycosylase [Anaeropeptidivorans aminofermentans]